MGKTRVVFIDPGVKANSSHYCNIVLEKGLLPDGMHSMSIAITGGHASGWSATAHRPDHDRLSEHQQRAHQLH